MLRRICVGLLLAAGCAAQAPQGGRAFEVASIRPAAPYTIEQRRAGTANVGLKIDGAKVLIGSISLKNLVMLAYHVKPYQVTSPDWMIAEKFDVAANLPEGATRDDVPEMLRALLVERFKLAAHRESRDYPVYALVVGKNGLKMREAPPDTVQKYRPSIKPDGAMHVDFVTTMAAFADFGLPGVSLDRPVVDMTGLKGLYEGAMDVARNEARVNAAPADTIVPTGVERSPFFEAVEQLGLKLEPRRVPMEMVVVDHMEKTPTEN